MVRPFKAWTRLLVNTVFLSIYAQFSTIAFWGFYMLLGFFATGSKHMNDLPWWPAWLYGWVAFVALLSIAYNVSVFLRGGYDDHNPLLRGRTSLRQRIRA